VIYDYACAHPVLEWVTRWVSGGCGGWRLRWYPRWPGSHRGIPDVSFDADPNTGVAVYDSVPYEGQTGWFMVGGTGLSAPSWSAILAAADRLRVGAGKSPLASAGGQAARAVYAASSALGDITTRAAQR
jgi:hypothetical protein